MIECLSGKDAGLDAPPYIFYLFGLKLSDSGNWSRCNMWGAPGLVGTVAALGIVCGGFGG